MTDCSQTKNNLLMTRIDANAKEYHIPYMLASMVFIVVRNAGARLALNVNKVTSTHMTGILHTTWAR